MYKKKYVNIIICLLIIFLFGIIIFHAQQIKLYKKNITEIEQKAETHYPDIYDYLDSVVYNNFENFISNYNGFVYIGRPSCSDCSLFEPDLISFLKMNNTLDELVYLNVDKLVKKKEEWDIFKNKYDIQYTPTFIHVKQGKITDKIEWTPEKGISMAAVAKWIDSQSENNISVY